jgi:hypothetical protein
MFNLFSEVTPTSPRPSAVTNKTDMTAAMVRGEFGNTVKMFFSLEAWLASEERRKYDSFAIRSVRFADHPHKRLFVPRCEVEEHVKRYFGDDVNISVTVDSIVNTQAMLRIQDAALPQQSGDRPGTLFVEGKAPVAPGDNWIKIMRDPPQRWTGVSARVVLRHYLNHNSLVDLYQLLERYPGHVIAMSAFDRSFGTVPGRNGVIWGVRNY